MRRLEISASSVGILLKVLILVVPTLICFESVANAQIMGAGSSYPTETEFLEQTNAKIFQWRMIAPVDAVLPKLPSTRPWLGNCARYIGFQPEIVKTELRKRRDALVASLADGHHSALSAYILDEFPLDVVETTSECVTGTTVILPDSLHNNQLRVISFTANLTAFKSPVIALEISSTPSDAVFSFSPKYDQSGLVQVKTDTNIQRVLRGRYRYSVKKDGYVLVEGGRSLMDGENIKITCKLVREPPPSSGEPSHSKPPVTPLPCNFQ